MSVVLRTCFAWTKSIVSGRKSVDYSYQKELSESAGNHHNMAVKDGMGELLLEIFVVVVVVETGCWHLAVGAPIRNFGYSCRETIKAADFIRPKLYFFTDPPQAIRGIL
ncbi:hypothetical protein J1N35_021814 [Gossypium stocksii]|uniref:Uncharacterized protein n=1 Tax=Gossypium stocksii TaxID=47602 RepID=A0A9D3VFJ4_9ROSI|nr:hypothetical protein J1N35_021814 [Gossypium stocksii]